jgi:hypothetical protein
MVSITRAETGRVTTSRAARARGARRGVPSPHTTQLRLGQSARQSRFSRPQSHAVSPSQHVRLGFSRQRRGNGRRAAEWHRLARWLADQPKVSRTGSYGGGNVTRVPTALERGSARRTIRTCSRGAARAPGRDGDLPVHRHRGVDAAAQGAGRRVRGGAGEASPRAAGARGAGTTGSSSTCRVTPSSSRLRERRLRSRRPARCSSRLRMARLEHSRTSGLTVDVTHATLI